MVFQGRKWLGRDGSTAWTLLALLLLGLPAALPLLSPGFIGTRAYGDSFFLVQRLFALDQAISSGVLYPRWAPELAYGYGYPLFNFYAPLPYYLAEAFKLLGAGYLGGLKLAQLVGMFGAGLGMYFLVRSLWGPYAGLLAGVAYVYAPYHLVNVYLRGDALSEFTAYAWFPLILWLFLRLARRPTPSRLALASLSYAALLYTHNISALGFTPVLMAFALVALLVERAGWRAWAAAAGAGLLGLGLAAAFWVPALGEREYVQLESMTTGYFDFHGHFLSLRRLLALSPVYPFDVADVGREGLPFRLGLVQVLAALPALLWLFWLLASGLRGGTGYGFRATGNGGSGAYRFGLVAYPFFFLLVGLAAAGLMLPHSAPIWERAPLLPMFQFPWRLLCLTALATSVLTASLALLLRSQPRALLGASLATCAAIMLASTIDLRPERWNLSESAVSPATVLAYEYLTSSIGSTARYEYLPRWVKDRPWASPAVLTYPDVQRPPLARGGAARAEMVATTAHSWRVRVEMDRAGTVQFHAFYFPGWQAEVDGQSAAARASDPVGLLELDLPAGVHEVAFTFGDTPLRSWATRLSLVCLALWGVLWVLGVWARLPLSLRKRASLLTRGAPSNWFPLPRGERGRVRGGGAGQSVGNLAPNPHPSPLPGRERERAALTPALSQGERERAALADTREGRLLPLPLGEGRGEGAATASHPWPFLAAYAVLAALLVGVRLLWLDPWQPAPAMAASEGWSTAFGASSAPLPVPRPGGLDFGGATLLAHQLSDLPAQPGDRFDLKLRWRLNQEATAGLRARARLILASELWGVGERTLAAADADLEQAEAHASGEAQDRITTHRLVVPEGAPPGLYLVSVSLWQEERALAIAGAWSRPSDSEVWVGPVVVSRAAGSPVAISDAQADFGGRLALLSSEAEVEQTPTGDVVKASLRWAGLAPALDDFRFSLRLVDAQGHRWGQEDAQPAEGLYPTRMWAPGELVLDQHYLAPIPGTPPGTYNLELRVYSLRGLSALDVLDENGAPTGQSVSISAIKLTAPRTSDDGLPIPRVGPVRLAPGLELLGYAAPPASVSPGGSLQLSLGWRALAGPGTDYHLQASLVDASGQVVANWEREPANPEHPTSLWVTGEVVLGQYSFRLPATVPAGRYDLVVSLAGAGAAGEQMIGEVEVVGRPRLFVMPPIQRRLAADLGDSIALLGYDLSASSVEQGDTLVLTLYWQCRRQMDRSYTVFAHLLDRQSRISGQKDSPPGAGELPTSGWVEGEIVMDRYEIPVKADAPLGKHQIEVGMYDPGSGQRLPVVQKGQRLPDDRLLLAEVLVEGP